MRNGEKEEKKSPQPMLARDESIFPSVTALRREARGACGV